jgi:hypothetical protein
LIAFLKTLQRLKQEWQKRPALWEDQANRQQNLVWFGEIERKLAKLSMPTLLTALPLNYFMIGTKPCSCTRIPGECVAEPAPGGEADLLAPGGFPAE